MVKKINTTLNTVFNALSKDEDLFRLIFIMKSDCLDRDKYRPKRVQDGWFYAEGDKASVIKTNTLYVKSPAVNFAERNVECGIIGFFFGGQTRLENNMDNLVTILDLGFVVPVNHEVLDNGKSRILSIMERIIEIIQDIEHENANLLYLSSSPVAEEDLAGAQFVFTMISSEDE